MEARSLYTGIYGTVFGSLLRRVRECSFIHYVNNLLFISTMLSQYLSYKHFTDGAYLEPSQKNDGEPAKPYRKECIARLMTIELNCCSAL